MESHVVKTDAVYKRLWFLWGYWRLFLRFSWILAIFLQFVRFCCMKVPNAWTKFFVVICNTFQHFLLGIKYFLTLLNPLFPRVPVLTVVKYRVKNASWPGAAGSCQSRPGSVFSRLWVWSIVPLTRRWSKLFLSGKRISFSHAYSKNTYPKIKNFRVHNATTLPLSEKVGQNIRADLHWKSGQRDGEFMESSASPS